ncbi:MAG TPA: lectin-like protein [Polyangiaceae bacterium]|nr:lectin-like protein [Polyangiaceae bacterium]
MQYASSISKRHLRIGFVGSASAFLLAMALSGCSSVTPSSTSDQETVSVAEQALTTSFSVITLSGNPNDTILSATGKLSIDSRVDIGDGSKLETVSSFGAGSANQTFLQSAAVIHGNLTSVAPVKLESQAKVEGFARSAGTITKDAGATIAVEYPSATNITSQTTSWNVNFPDTDGGAVTVNTLEQRTLAPGAWGDVQLIGGDTVEQGAKLTLTSGTYFFKSFVSNPKTQIFLNKSAGPIYIYVKEKFTYKGGFVTTVGVATETLVAALGTDAAGSGEAVVYLEAPMTGTVVAPNGTIDLRRPPNDQPHRGAFFGKNIHVFSDIDVYHAPFDFRCSLGDQDRDGTDDCTDACPLDPSKTAPGLAGCGKSETDADGDKLPNVIDGCKNDAKNQVEGQCGCAGSSAAPVGTPCTDSVCPSATNTTCDGAGVCGDPASCAPAASGCTVRRFQNSIYWFCTSPVTWSQAASNCRAVSGRYLARINSRVENDFFAQSLGGKAWHGGNDSSTEGTWRWSSASSNNGDPFWSGDGTGSSTSGRYAKWAQGQPTTANDCGAVQPASSGGQWTAEACTGALAYVCEQPVNFAPPPVRDLDLGKFFPERGGSTPPQQATSCVPEATALPWTKAQAEQQITACNAAFNNGTCTETQSAGCSAACKGIATVPPAGSTGSCSKYTPDELAQCALRNVVEAGCTAGVDCCSYVENEILSQSFETSVGTFTYVDDAFLGTTQPSYAAGQRVTSGGNPGAAAQVTLGGIDNTLITNMSGGWRSNFTVPAVSDVILSFDYNLTQSPNYESSDISQVMVRVDGVVKGLNLRDHVEQIAGNGDGGANISTGWRSARLNLGDLSAGPHVFSIGAYNNAKNNANETTTLLIDNVRLIARDDTCAAGQICGPVYSSGCNPCDTVDANGKCTKNCPPPVLRCGTRTAKCADTSISGSTCSMVELCSGPEATGSSDPRTNGDLTASPAFDPVTEFGQPTAPATKYYADPACETPPCSAGFNNRWCRYEPKIWNDPVVKRMNPEVIDPMPAKATRPDTKRGESGSSALKFVFDPDAHLDYSLDPLGGGQTNFYLDTSASLLSTVGFDIGSDPLRVKAKVDIVDALVKLHLDRCHATTLESKLVLFGDDFLPSLAPQLLFDEQIPNCEAAIDEYGKALNRVRKAYKDAMELVRQYKARKSAAEKFPADFCQKLTAELPDFFPAGSCATETAAATVNRFIDYYESEIKRVLEPANVQLTNKVLSVSGTPINVPSTPTRESETLVEVTFMLGPVPMRLEVEAFVEYGIGGNLRFELNPNALLANTGERETLANVDAHVDPYALSGITMFVGAGFGWGDFGVSAGVEGAVTLGRLSLDNYAGAGVAVQVTKDDREFPSDVKAAVDQATADGRLTLFPPAGAKKYDFSLQYNYGSKIVISEVLKGAIAGRVRLKMAFFSKEWRKVLFTFPGFGPFEVPLISGGGNAPAFSIDPHKWGSFQVPFPFAKLARLNPLEVLTGTARAFDTSNVEEPFYDNLCHCSNTAEPCTRRADCCDSANQICFSDPAVGGQGVCSACRQRAQTCNSVADCCPGRGVTCSAPLGSTTKVCGVTAF